jgi:hypothetical protein
MRAARVAPCRALPRPRLRAQPRQCQGWNRPACRPNQTRRRGRCVGSFGRAYPTGKDSQTEKRVLRVFRQPVLRAETAEDLIAQDGQFLHESAGEHDTRPSCGSHAPGGMFNRFRPCCETRHGTTSQRQVRLHADWSVIPNYRRRKGKTRYRPEVIPVCGGMSASVCSRFQDASILPGNEVARR